MEHWQRLKVHGIPLERYLGEGKMELLRQEVELLTGIQLKALPCWLISEDRLREAKTTGNKWGSAIVIIVKGETKAKKLYTSNQRFDGLIRVVEKYWKVGSSSVCVTSCGIEHRRMGGYGNQPAKCIIYIGEHKVEEYKGGVIGCTKGKRRICPHITIRCDNCGGNHMAYFLLCSSRHKAGIKKIKKKCWRNKVKKRKKKL